MAAIGIICEYDPCHNGHEHQIKLVDPDGDNTVVCLMSGNATQRGGFSIADKYTRAEAALELGADLVLELPFPYSAAGAEFFASAGICILDAMGVDEISFGSETGDIDALTEAASLIVTEEFDVCYRSILKASPSMGTAAAYAEAYRKMTGNELFRGSNDILAMAYISAHKRSQSEIKLTAVKRCGTAYSAELIKENDYPSATALRSLFRSGAFDKAYAYMPKGAASVFRSAADRGAFPTDIRAIENAIIAFFRTADPSSLAEIAEAGGGIAQRLCDAAINAVDLDGLTDAVATKRYTRARLNRAMLFCLTGVTYEDLRRTPEYVTLLAADRKGRDFLNAHANSRGINVVSKPADAPNCRQRRLSERLDAWFTLAMPKRCAGDEFVRRSPKISKKD